MNSNTNQHSRDTHSIKDHDDHQEETNDRETTEAFCAAEGEEGQIIEVLGSCGDRPPPVEECDAQSRDRPPTREFEMPPERQRVPYQRRPYLGRNYNPYHRQTLHNYRGRNNFTQPARDNREVHRQHDRSNGSRTVSGQNSNSHSFNYRHCDSRRFEQPLRDERRVDRFYYSQDERHTQDYRQDNQSSHDRRWDYRQERPNDYRQDNRPFEDHRDYRQDNRPFDDRRWEDFYQDNRHWTYGPGWSFGR
jgi:hypothetical protein